MLLNNNRNLNDWRLDGFLVCFAIRYLIFRGSGIEKGAAGIPGSLVKTVLTSAANSLAVLQITPSAIEWFKHHDRKPFKCCKISEITSYVSSLQK